MHLVQVFPPRTLGEPPRASAGDPLFTTGDPLFTEATGEPLFTEGDWLLGGTFPATGCPLPPLDAIEFADLDNGDP